MSSAFRFESFSRAPPAPSLTIFQQRDLDAAYAEGLAEGQARHEQSEIENLCVELRQLSESVQKEISHKHDRYRDAIQLFSPVLHEVLALISDDSFAKIIEESLRAELELHLETINSATCAISCSGKLKKIVADCVELTCPATVHITENQDTGVEVRLDKSRVILDEELLAKNLTELVKEMLEESKQ